MKYSKIKIQQAINLQDLRKNPISIPSNISDKLIKHKHYKAFCIYLELKPLFVNSIIYNENGKYPYSRLESFLNISPNTLRSAISVLKRYKLISFDNKRNMILGRYQLLYKHFTDNKINKYIKRHKLKNDGNTQAKIRALAINENHKKQNFILFEKIFHAELKNYLLDTNMVKPQTGINLDFNKLKSLEYCKLCFSKRELKRIKKSISINYDIYLSRYKKIYRIQMQQQDGIKDHKGYTRKDLINTDITLSCVGISKLLGKTSASTGHYQSAKLFNLGLIEITRKYLKIEDQSPAIFENMIGIRNDSFSYDYPARKELSGLKRKYFINLPNLIQTNDNAIFI